MPKTAPARTEAAEYFFTYINQVPPGDIVHLLHVQTREFEDILDGIDEEQSLYRYAPGKWSIRDVLAHINDSERIFAYRLFWFARGFDSPLPSFDEVTAAIGAEADRLSWQHHRDEFAAVRQSTLALLEGLRPADWNRTGIASDHPFSVRALAYIIAGHATHHLKVIQERYLPVPVGR